MLVILGQSPSAREYVVAWDSVLCRGRHLQAVQSCLLTSCPALPAAAADGSPHTPAASTRDFGGKMVYKTGYLGWYKSCSVIYS